MSKTLLVLAASNYQLDTIRTAKRLGYRVITTDNVPGNPGHALADHSFDVSTTDVSGVLQLARREGIDGVIAPCTDIATYTAAVVAEALGLPGSPPTAARIATDKAAFRRFQLGHGLAAPPFVVLRSNDPVPADVFDDGQRRVLKPDRSSGSKGVFVVADLDDLQRRLPESRTFSSDGTVVLERYIEGHQGTCEGVLAQGRIVAYAILDRQTAPLPYATTIGHHLPSAIDPSRLLDQLQNTCRLLGIADGPFDCDFVLANGEPYVLEITPRLGGNSISTLLRAACGSDLVEYAIRTACGEHPAIPDLSVREASAIVLLGADRPGRLDYDQSAAEQLAREPWVRSLVFDVPIGAPVLPFINGRHRIGEALIAAPTREALEARVTELRIRIAISSL